MRKAAVAGSFYAGSSAGLRRQIEDCFRHSLGPGALPRVTVASERKILGLVSPHAGYVYSGPVAAHGFFRIVEGLKPETVVIIGPNHRGLGASVAIGRVDRWDTPLGPVELDTEVAEAVASGSKWVEEDDAAHVMEHSIEVQVPFLQYVLGSGFRMVPVAMMRQDLTVSQDLGRAVASAVKTKEALIIASSDFSHYEPQPVASSRDRLALNAILDLDPARLEAVVKSNQISMCGPGPVIAMLTACKDLGAKRARLLKYATSGDITGDYSQVVGYASVEITD